MPRRPAAVQLAEPRIAISVGMPLDVLVPQDLQRDVLALQLAVNRRPIGLAAPPVPLLLSGCGEELPFQHPCRSSRQAMANSARRQRAASTSAEPLTTPRRPDGQSRCRTHRRHLIEARRAPGASRSSLLASSPPVAKAKGTDAKRQQRRSLSGRLHPGIPGEIISERRATSNRNGARDHPGIPGDFSRNQQSLHRHSRAEIGSTARPFQRSPRQP